MEIKKLRLSDFRNFNSKLIEFSPHVTVIVGSNASGKTNILESIYLVATGKSFKAKVEEEMINYDKNLCRAKARIETNGDNLDLEVMLTRGYLETESPLNKIPRKKLTVNKIPKRLVDFAGNLKVTFFGPWDLELISESPSIRRKFLDMILSQVDREYRRATISYDKGLRQRNRLLFRIKEEGISRSQLLYWDHLLIKNGDYISTKREELIKFINETKPLNNQIFEVEYDKSAISEGRLDQYKEEEIAAATTLVGPHRDDFIIKSKTVKKKGSSVVRDLSRYGSRGEQRMGVLWLKLAELNYIEKIIGKRPVLLLDDIFSELDHEHRDIVMDVITKQQTIITTADPHYVKGMKRVEKIKL